MNDSNKNIQESFDLSLIDNSLVNISADIAELTIDDLLKDGLMKEIPIVKSLINFYDIGVNIHDKLFVKKIISFLYNLKDIPIKKRREMIDKIDNLKEFKIKVGEKLLFIIDSCDDYEISELIGILFSSYINEKINYSEFLKVSKILQGITINDFKLFIKRNPKDWSLDNVGDLINSGLFELYYEQVDVHVEDETDYKMIRESSRKLYKTEVDGGGIIVFISRSGEILLETFSKDYIKPNKIKI